MDPFNIQDNEDQEADRVILNVGGVRFETYVTTLQNIADTRLAWLIENVEEETLRKREFFFDRHPGAFVHILNFYRTGRITFFNSRHLLISDKSNAIRNSV